MNRTALLLLSSVPAERDSCAATSLFGFNECYLQHPDFVGGTSTILFGKTVEVACPERSEGSGNSIEQINMLISKTPIL